MNTTRFSLSLSPPPQKGTRKSSPCVCVLRLRASLLGAGARSAHDDETRRAARPQRTARSAFAAPRRARRRAPPGALARELANNSSTTTISPQPRRAASNDTRVRVAYYMLAKCSYCEKVSTTIFRHPFGGLFEQDIVDIIAIKVVCSLLMVQRHAVLVHARPPRVRGDGLRAVRLTTLAGGD